MAKTINKIHQEVETLFDSVCSIGYSKENEDVTRRILNDLKSVTEEDVIKNSRKLVMLNDTLSFIISHLFKDKNKKIMIEKLTLYMQQNN